MCAVTLFNTNFLTTFAFLVFKNNTANIMGKVNEESTSVLQFPVVGIGASAGGLDAVRAFLQALPAKPGMAFVFVQHLSPEHTSILPEILEKVSPIPVHQITDNLHLEKDNFYII